jgi:hypothetical protein
VGVSAESATGVVVLAGIVTGTSSPWVIVKFVGPSHSDLFVVTVMLTDPVAGQAGIVKLAGFGFVNVTFTDWLNPGENGVLRLPPIAKPLLFVNEKFAGVPTPAAVAVTVYEPDELFAVNVGAVAKPFASVVTTQVLPEQVPPKVPDAPEAGALNVTCTPGTGTLPAPVTFATSGANAVLGFAICDDPDDTMIAVWVTVPLIVQHDVVVGPTFPAVSVANTAKQCDPAARLLYWISPKVEP